MINKKYIIPEEVLNLCKFTILQEYKIRVDQLDGMLIYDGNINLNCNHFYELPEALLHFKEITGLLNLFYCPEIRNLKGLDNLRRVGKFINLEACTKLESLDGLENLTSVKQIKFYDNYNLYCMKAIAKNLTIRKIGGDKAKKLFEDCKENELVKEVFKFVLEI